MEKNRYDYTKHSTRTVIFQVTIVVTLTLGLLLSSCDPKKDLNLLASGKTYEVSPGFRELYASLGGEEVLGPAISKLIDYDSMQCQYTSNVLLCLNPLMIGEGRLNLYPLGTTLELGSTAPDNTYPIYEEFSDFYQQFSGDTYAGAPITPLHLNFKQQRIEQYFENVGFYRRFSDSPGTVHLIAYGAIHCADQCNYIPALEASVFGLSSNLSEISLLDRLNKSGDVSVFGKPLTQPYLAADGLQEQVYETVILYFDENLNTVKLRSLPRMLNMFNTEPGEKKFGKEEGVVFYAVKNGLGYHIPIVFDEFINEHGGYLTSGDPIAEVIEYETGIYRQCFANYCLEYTPDAENPVSLVRLGVQYLEFVQDSVLSTQAVAVTPQVTALDVELYSPQIAATEKQRIDLFVYHPIDHSPIPGVESEIILTLPDGSTWRSDFAPTLADGRTSMMIPAMKTISNASIINYEVCLKSSFVEAICENGSYLIWNK